MNAECLKIMLTKHHLFAVGICVPYIQRSLADPEGVRTRYNRKGYI